MSLLADDGAGDELRFRAPVYYIPPDEAAVSLKPVMTALSANYSGDPGGPTRSSSLVEELMENGGSGRRGPDIEFASRTLVYQAVMGPQGLTALCQHLSRRDLPHRQRGGTRLTTAFRDERQHPARYRLLRKLGVKNR